MTKDEIKILRLELAGQNKDFIMKFFYTPLVKFLTLNEAKYQSQLSLYGIKDLRKVPVKEDMLDIAFKLFSDKQFITDYLANLGKIAHAVFTKAVWHGGLDRKALEVLFKQNVLFKKHEWNSYYKTELIPEVKSVWGQYITIIEPNGYYGDKELSLAHTDLLLSFPTALRKLLAIQMPKPEGYEFTAIPEPGSGFALHLTESIVFSELPRIIAYHAQGNIKYSQKGNPNQASAKKMSKALKLAEFNTDAEFPTRSLLVAGLLSDDFKIKTITDTPEKIISKLFASDFFTKQTAPYLLTHLKGLNYFSFYDYQRDSTDNILKVFKQLPTNEWISFDNLQNFVQSHFLDILPLSDWYLRNKIQAEYEITRNGSLEKQTVSLNHGMIHAFVWKPYLAGHVYLLAALGLMDLALDPTVPNQYTPYDRLHAFRLTNLGAYILGLTKLYAAPASDNRTTLSFDENSTIIRIEGDIVLGDTMLANYATKVSENRYQFSTGKFLKECKSTKDIQNKIVLFKQTIGQKLPAFWEDYLQELVANSKSIVHQSRIQVFTIPPENKGLQRIIVQDELLRKLVVKAEQYHILIEDAKLSAFINRMKELGYVLN